MSTTGQVKGEHKGLVGSYGVSKQRQIPWFSLTGEVKQRKPYVFIKQYPQKLESF